MKIKCLILAIVGSVILISCQKEESLTTISQAPDGVDVFNQLKGGSTVESLPVFTFLSVEYTAAGNTVFSYEVTSGTKPALSHWNLNIVPGTGEGAVTQVIVLGSNDQTAGYGKDGSLKKAPGGLANLQWLKFDKSYCDGETRLVSFTLQGRWFVGDLLSVSKSGNKYLTCYLPGPVQVRVPSLSTLPVENFTEYTAEVNGVVTSDGGMAITERGVCWSTEANPSILINKITDGVGSGPITANLIDLEGKTTYFVRVYAINGMGITYGNEVSFTTKTPVR